VFLETLELLYVVEELPRDLVEMIAAQQETLLAEWMELNKND
jgi:hypothetical protein